VLHTLGMAKSLLYVGFGAGLRDPNFLQFRRWLGRVGATMPYRHYRLVRADEVESVRRDHDADERVMVLAYGATHAELPPFLRALAPAERAAAVPMPLAFEKTSSTRVDPEPPLPEFDDPPLPGSWPTLPVVHAPPSSAARAKAARPRACRFAARVPGSRREHDGGSLVQLMSLSFRGVRDRVEQPVSQDQRGARGVVILPS